MIISDERSKVNGPQYTLPEDMLDIKKFNSLPGPVTARIVGGGEYWIETLCVQTGLMRLDVSGQIDFNEFAMVAMLIDSNGIEHDPDDFYLAM